LASNGIYFSLTLDWLKHKLLAAKRVLKGLPADYFISQYKQQSININKERVSDLSALPQLCNICGFSMGEMKLTAGWSIRACSASGFKRIRQLGL
jgi:hypothetical protein